MVVGRDAARRCHGQCVDLDRVGLGAAVHLEIVLQSLLGVFLRIAAGRPHVDAVGEPLVAPRYGPRRALGKAHLQADVDAVIIGEVHLGDVAVHDGEGYLPARNLGNQLGGYRSLAFDRMDRDASTHLVVEVAQAGLILGPLLDIHVAADELRHVIDDVLAAVLDEHLIGLVDRAAVQHARLVLGSDGNLTGQHVDLPLVEHLEQFGHAACHLEPQCDAIRPGKVAHAVIVIAHRVALEDKEARGAIECAHIECVGQTMLLLGVFLLAPAGYHER